MYGGAGDNADIWEWKAHRTGLAGFADDMHISDTMIATDPQDQENDGLYFRNYDDFHRRPRYMQPGGPDDTTTGLLEGDLVTFDRNLEWMTFSLDPDIAPTAKPVPGYYMFQNTWTHGSRWDVKTVSKYDAGSWTVVFQRKLNTGDAGDVEFDFSGLDSIMVTIGITDNSGIKHHGSGPFPLVFLP